MPTQRPPHDPPAGDVGAGTRPDESGHQSHDEASPKVTHIPAGATPSRQLRRVGVKIGKTVLEFQRPVFRLGPLHIYRSVSGRLVLRWRRRG